MTHSHDPFAVPDWMLDAWQAAVNNSRGVPTPRLVEQASAADERRAFNAGSWSYWNYASLLAVIGWRQVVAHRRSQDSRELGEWQCRVRATV